MCQSSSSANGLNIGRISLFNHLKLQRAANLNELPAFEHNDPIPENIAQFLYTEIGKILNSEYVRVSKIKVYETPGAGAFYWEE